MNDVSVLVVDDQLPFRWVAQSVIECTEGFAAVGEVDDGDAVVTAIETLHPDLILMDVTMERIDGIRATLLARAADPHLTVVLCSTYPLADLPATARTCGASGYLSKERLDSATLIELWDRRGEAGFVTY